MVDFRDPLAANFSTYRNGNDTLTLRKVLGRWATGVTIATTMSDDEKPHGLTVNSFTSVSLDPPLVLFCIAKDAGSLPHFLQNQYFAINILNSNQSQISGKFAAHNIDRFENIEWQKGEFGAPLINEALGLIECQFYEAYEAGDHHIIIGKVEKANFDQSKEPLLYYQGQYQKIEKSE